MTMYLATLVCPIAMPSFSSSPWIRGAPHRGLAMLISRISLRISSGTGGRPPRARDFQRQDKREARTVQFDDGPGPNNRKRIKNAREGDKDPRTPTGRWHRRIASWGQFVA